MKIRSLKYILRGILRCLIVKENNCLLFYFRTSGIFYSFNCLTKIIVDTLLKHFIAMSLYGFLKNKS